MWGLRGDAAKVGRSIARRGSLRLSQCNNELLSTGAMLEFQSCATGTLTLTACSSSRPAAFWAMLYAVCRTSPCVECERVIIIPVMR